MTPTQREMLANIRRAAEASLKFAQSFRTEIDPRQGRIVDSFQHIIDDIKRLEAE